MESVFEDKPLRPFSSISSTTMLKKFTNLGMQTELQTNISFPRIFVYFEIVSKIINEFLVKMVQKTPKCR
jgi:hypothetical protein